MKRKNRIETLKGELLEMDKETIQRKKAELLEDREALAEAIRVKKEPFNERINKLHSEIEKIEKERDDALSKLREERDKLDDGIESVKMAMSKLSGKEKELAWLEGLEEIKKVLDEYSVFIKSVKIKSSVGWYPVERYTLGDVIGTDANWSTPSRITDIKLSETTFRIKSEIAKNYRSISLRGGGYPDMAVIKLADGIFAEEITGSRIKTCPKCRPDSKRSDDGFMTGEYGLPQMRCPICHEYFYWKCKKCGHVWDEDPQCEHKDMLVTMAHYRPINTLIFTFKDGVWERKEERREK